MATQRTNRRSFLKRSSAAAGSLFAAPAFVPARALGNEERAAASERITVGFVGMGLRGNEMLPVFLAHPDVQVIAVSDCAASRLQDGKKRVDSHYGDQGCAAYPDFLELLDRKDLDAVFVAAGDNWNAGVSILAARAGKDIYGEKPMGLTIAEARAVSETVRRFGRVYQCGTQRRNIGRFQIAVDLAHSGKLGQLREVHAGEGRVWRDLHHETLPAQPTPPKEVFDWDRWLGPAQWRPYNETYWTRKYWSAHTDFAGGSVTEFGSHTVDLCQWVNHADDTGPVAFWQEDDRIYGSYENGVKLVIRTGVGAPGGACAIRFEGDEGWVQTGDAGEFNVHPKSLLQARSFQSGYPADGHVREFLDCVKSRQQPTSHPEVARRSVTACHVANLCKRLGRGMKWDPVKEEIIGDEEAARMCSRAYREPWFL